MFPYWPTFSFKFIQKSVGRLYGPKLVARLLVSLVNILIASPSLSVQKEECVSTLFLLKFLLIFLRQLPKVGNGFSALVTSFRRKLLIASGCS